MTLDSQDHFLNNEEINTSDLILLGNTQHYRAWITSKNLNFSVSALGSEKNRSLMMNKAVKSLGSNIVPFFPPLEHTLNVLCLKSVNSYDCTSQFLNQNQNQFDLYLFSGEWMRKKDGVGIFNFVLPSNSEPDLFDTSEILNITKTFLGRIIHNKNQLFDLEDFPLADGAITDSPWIAPGVTVADCYPLFLGGKSGINQGQGVHGTLHSGWKGTGILAVAAYGMQDIWNIPYSGIEVMIGPGICGSCYPVGQERASILQKRFGPKGILKVPGTGDYEGLEQPGVDLLHINSTIIDHLQMQNCTNETYCTYENRGFWSHRRYQLGRRALEANGISVTPQDDSIDGRMFAFVTPLSL